MLFQLPKLKYELSALEPYMDAETLDLHYNKHHAHYVEKLNESLDEYPQLQGKPLEQLLMQLDEMQDPLRAKIRHFGGGHYNHSLLWDTLTPSKKEDPTGPFLDEIKNQLGGFSKFKSDFTKGALEIFGSGYMWLCLTGCNELVMTCTENQDCPLSHHLKPILLIDMWEHAHYLRYKNERESYVEAYWHLIDWDIVTARWQHVTNPFPSIAEPQRKAS